MESAVAIGKSTKNSITVGASLVMADGTYTDDPEDGHAIFIHWVRIGDVMLSTEEMKILAVDHHADGEGVHKISVTFAAGKYEVVDGRLGA